MKTIRLKRKANIIPDDIFTYLGCQVIGNYHFTYPKMGFVKSIRICDYKYNKDYKYAIYITIRIDDIKYPNFYKGFVEKYITDFMFYLSSQGEKFLSLVACADDDYLVASN